MVFVQLSKSANAGKKYMAVFYDDERKKTKTTHFGQAGAPDFTKTKDEERKKLYLERHANNENWNDYTSAGALSRWILWNQPSLSSSYIYYLNKFNLKKY